jgi:hypothetical protein
VVTNAHRINAGHYPQVRGLDDFFATDDAEEAARLTVDIAVRRIPAQFRPGSVWTPAGMCRYSPRCTADRPEPAR